MESLDEAIAALEAALRHRHLIEFILGYSILIILCILMWGSCYGRRFLAWLKKYIRWERTP